MKKIGEIANIASEEENDENPYMDEDVDGNQLISYTGNIPDFEDIALPDLEAVSPEETCISPTPSVIELNTPQIESPINRLQR